MRYYRYQEILSYLEELADNHPDFVKMSVEGKTAEDRSIILMTIGTSPNGRETPAVWFDAGKTVSYGNTNKSFNLFFYLPIFFNLRVYYKKQFLTLLFTGIHAREWVAPTSGLYTIDQIIQNHINASTGDPFHEDVVACDWYIMPLLNPDGYENSHTHDRMWRKNRTPDPKGKTLHTK